MTLEENKSYWIEHPEHGTIFAKLVLLSGNGVALAFVLPHPICLRIGSRLAATDRLPVVKFKGEYTDIITGDSWKIHETEPAVKLPTK